VHETKAPDWDAAAPNDLAGPRDATPLLAGAMLTVPAEAMRRGLKRSLRAAAASVTPNLATLRSALNANLDDAAMFEASVCQDVDRITALTPGSGVNLEAWQAVIALVAFPLLHACRRRYASAMPESWVEGYCPICGAWPAFAEVRGIEQRRFFRCGRCGVEWHARLLRCAYCNMTDHDELVSLVPEHSGVHAVIDACRRCHGYVKALNRLQGCDPETVMLEDLASVDLDIAALDQGYARPSSAGYPLQATVTAPPATRRLFAWRA
jgi:FdhE protein